MAFSKVFLFVVFAVLVISAEISAHRDLAEIETAPTTDLEGGGGFNRGVSVTNPGGSVSCNRKSKVPCQSSGRNGVPIPKCNNNPTSRECYRNGNGGKGGRGGHGPETKN